MLLQRLNYFELKVLRVHCTGGVFALRTERCQRWASQDLYRKLMLPVETEPNSHRSERGECGRKQSLFFRNFTQYLLFMHPDAFTVTHLSQLQLQSHHQTWFSTFLGGQSQGTEDVFLIISNVMPSSLTDSHLLYLKDVCKLPKLT